MKIYNNKSTLCVIAHQVCCERRLDADLKSTEDMKKRLDVWMKITTSSEGIHKVVHLISCHGSCVHVMCVPVPLGMLINVGVSFMSEHTIYCLSQSEHQLKTLLLQNSFISHFYVFFYHAAAECPVFALAHLPAAQYLQKVGKH